MASSSERVPVFYGQVATTQWARWIGWLVLVPLTVLFFLLGLSLLALALRLWFAQHNLETVFLCALMSVLCFLVTYLVTGWAYQILALSDATGALGANG
jgi:bacteriorhodopsin